MRTGAGTPRSSSWRSSPGASSAGTCHAACGRAPTRTAAPRGPVVAVANEFSGSDGDIVNAAIQALKIGPVVGTRTWGGVVGIDNRYGLVDGTSVTQPKYAFWFETVGWGVENHGVDPDVEVVVAPHQYAAGEDPQLDEAIRLALATLEETPAKRAPALPGGEAE
ncbi:tricorn protease [Streptomyces sp. SolWspMP-sol7th]|nr:tricorn protease [Streptomyces sp. SolWspMP-sol7th]